MTTTTASTAFNTCAVVLPVSDYALDELRKAFTTLHYYPEGDIPKELAAETEIWFCKWFGLPEWARIEDVPKTKILQLASAGANLALKHPIFQSAAAREQISVCSASGIHVLTIPNYIVGQIMTLYFNLHTSIYISRAQGRWPRRPEVQYRAEVDPETPHVYLFGQGGYMTLRGKTAGLLGYGHIGRETARILKALNMEVIAANTSGERRVDDGYIIPGTGDEQGTIPSAYYSTTDPKSFKEFLNKTDILIASLPSTPATTYMLKKEHFAELPTDAIFINVGRGDLARSEDILAALDAPDGLLGVGLDVTDPEPLPDGHALLTHPRAVITPHISADTKRYFDHGADLLIANVTRIRAGGKPMNVVDPEKGY